jgi:chloride channel protein, CIC family
MAHRWIRPSRLLMRLRKVVRNDQLILSILAVGVGIAGGGAVIVFREGIDLIQSLAFGSGDARLFVLAGALPWWQVMLVPTAGGLLIGLLVRFTLPDRRPLGVADVIEANALDGGRMSLGIGLRAALINAASIGVGASVGREGPAVHLGAALGGWLARRLHLTRALSRTLLGCGVAAAVAASFNAPIAGALFAGEVVLGHYALSAFAPVVIASVAGTMVSQAYFGAFPAFAIAGHAIASYWEFPAFIGLGVLAAVAAVVFMRGVEVSARAAAPVPAWLRPALGGLAVGAIALAFPHVLGVGYGATEAALTTALPLGLLAAVCVAKIMATAISLGFGFGGGVFSPSLVIGAMLGGAYGVICTGILPEFSSGPGAYTVVGMGAVAAAVLGAPISTTLIVFEMTGDYKLTMAVMVAVVVASVITRQLHARSFFAAQLEQRGLDLRDDGEAVLLGAITVDQVMNPDCSRVAPGVALPEIRTLLQKSPQGRLFVIDAEGRLLGTITLADLSEAAFDPGMDDLLYATDVARRHPPVIAAGDSLDVALARFRDSGETHIAVIGDTENRVFLGCLHDNAVMAAYNKALVEHRREERGD